jgi:hypothetical protein
MGRLLHALLPASAIALSTLCVPALAAPSFGNDDLKGEYLFMIVEVRRVTLPTGVTVPEHCVVAGTATFDGAGLMTLNGRQRCNQTGSGTIGGTQYYSVNPDGSFLISESPSMSDPVHGELTEHGRTLLLDGTLRTLPEITGWWGVAMRR